MKRILSFLLCCLLALGFAGCTNGENSENKKQNGGASQSEGVTQDNYDWIDSIIG